MQMIQSNRQLRLVLMVLYSTESSRTNVGVCSHDPSLESHKFSSNHVCVRCGKRPILLRKNICSSTCAFRMTGIGWTLLPTLMKLSWTIEYKMKQDGERMSLFMSLFTQLGKNTTVKSTRLTSHFMIAFQDQTRLASKSKQTK